MLRLDVALVPIIYRIRVTVADMPVAENPATGEVLTAPGYVFADTSATGTPDDVAKWRAAIVRALAHQGIPKADATIEIWPA